MEFVDTIERLCPYIFIFKSRYVALYDKVKVIKLKALILKPIKELQILNL